MEGMLKLEGHEFKASLGYVVRLCQARSSSSIGIGGGAEEKGGKEQYFSMTIA